MGKRKKLATAAGEVSLSSLARASVSRPFLAGSNTHIVLRTTHPPLQRLAVVTELEQSHFSAEDARPAKTFEVERIFPSTYMCVELRYSIPVHTSRTNSLDQMLRYPKSYVCGHVGLEVYVGHHVID